jgi:ribosomal protein L24E
LDLEQVSLARLLTVFSVPVPAYDLPVDASAEFSFAGSDIHHGTGTLWVGDPEGRFRFDANLRGLGFDSFSARLDDAGLAFDAAGSLPFNAVDPVAIQGTLGLSDLESVQRFLSPFLPDFGTLSGCVDGRFSVDRSFGDPLLEVDAHLGGVRLFGMDWGSGPVAFTVTRKEPFAVSSLDLSLGGGTIHAGGSLGRGFEFRYDAWPWNLPFLMTLSGSGRMDLAPVMDIRGEVVRADIPILPFQWDRVHAGFAYDGRTLRLDPVQAWTGEGTFEGTGEFLDRFALRGELREFLLADGVPASGEFEAVFGEVLTGRADLTLPGAAPPFPLKIEADLGERDGRLQVATNGFGVLAARLTQLPGGRLGVEGTLEGMQLAGLPARIDPPVPAAVRLAGDPFDPASWSGTISLPPFDILQGESSRYRVPKGLTLAMAGGAVNLETTDIEHDWGFMEVSGSFRLEEGFPFEADLKAEFGDDIVGQMLPDLEYSGFASMELHAVRRERSLELNGGLRLDGYYLKIKPLRLILDKPKARVTFQRNRITLDLLEARTGEGNIGARGEAFLDRKGGLLAANLEFHADDLLIRDLEGFRLLLDGTGELVVTRDSRTLSAKVTLQNGLYTKDIDLVAELKKAFATDKAIVQTSRLPDIRLAVEIAIPGTMQFSNQLLEVTAGGRLQLAGTIARPVVLGAVETLAGSRVNFGGVQYQIIRATVQFNNPYAFDPALDLLAEATVQSYVVRLALSGPLSRLQTRLTSTPYLTEADIFSLLTTGAPGRESQQAVAAGAASLLISQQLSQRLTRSTSSFLGVDRVRIDPVVGETSVTGARLTLAKQISKDCLFSYTYNSDVNKGDIISLECTVAGNAFLTLMQEDDGSYSLQLMKREKF